MAETTYSNALTCAHCAAPIASDPIVGENHVFCCNGCHTVFNILNNHGLCEYYAIDEKAAVSLKNRNQSNWSLSELDLMVAEFLIAENGKQKTVLFHIPSIHCSSCIWLLEKLSDLNTGILNSRSDFLKKQLTITYDETVTSFGKIVVLLQTLGYEPSLVPEELNNKLRKKEQTNLIKLGVAGFCAGNIMLFTFPQYFGLNASGYSEIFKFFNVLNVLLSIPVVFYCGSEYLVALRHWVFMRTLSVKVPLGIGICALWARSVYEIFAQNGGGYFDSLSGLVFFLLAGNWLQNKVFESLRFGEKTRKFFPLVARTIEKGKIVPKKVVDLLPGDRVRISHGEIIPADGVLMQTSALIEYAFATGESTPQYKVAGEILLGGGKNAGANLEMEIIRPFNEGRLSEIWKSTDSNKEQEQTTLKFELKISKYFIASTLFIALGAFLFWLPFDVQNAWFALTAVLMVACPCALALAPPFSYNVVAGFFASKGLYLRKPEVVGSLGATELIVFDKTGTLTSSDEMLARIPASYTTEQIEILKALTLQSTHPYSQAILSALQTSGTARIEQYNEFPGRGVQALANEKLAQLGSFEWLSQIKNRNSEAQKKIWFAIDGQLLEPVEIIDHFRPELKNTLSQLIKQNLKLVIASGDSASTERELDKHFLNMFSQKHFECSPLDKTKIIEELKKDNHVLMVGDGLNDAGALKTGNVGMVITKNTNNFTPEASAILLQNELYNLPKLLSMAKKANRIVKESFAVSLLYNITAVSLAFAGKMEPVIAAILMPISAITLMLYAWLRTYFMVKKEGKK